MKDLFLYKEHVNIRANFVTGAVALNLQYTHQSCKDANNLKRLGNLFQSFNRFNFFIYQILNLKP